MSVSRSAGIAVAVVLAAIAACGEDGIMCDPCDIFNFGAIMGGGAVRPTATSSSGTGTATFLYTGSAITFTLSYTGLGANATRSRVHLASPIQVGAAGLALCGDGATLACPAATSGTISGTAVVIGGNDLQAIVNAMRAGNGAYVVVSTASSGDALENGEIRGNIAASTSGPF